MSRHSGRWFINSIHSGLRDCDEHRYTKGGGGGGGGVQLLKDANGAEYLKYYLMQTLRPKEFQYLFTKLMLRKGLAP